ncbi:MAG: hypothetical protein GXC73_00755 [Chitinophagaceae bacterium]|nr:hypothetical protein [Chitinophagaceae bacterium]
MKKILFFSAVAVSLFIGCEKNADLTVEQKEKEAAPVTPPSAVLTTNLPIEGTPTCAGPYKVVLESVANNGNGTYTWTWSVQNPKPGNGSNGTVQDLSHWNITLGPCITIDNIVGGATSTNGTDWTAFTPTFQADPSLPNTGCDITASVVKFNVGTSGSAKSYYRLTINEDVLVDPASTGYYKSGANTGCGTFCFPGFACKPEAPNEGCSFSQGYWFAKPNLVWAGPVTVGGHVYTQAEGKAIWNTSNAGGIPDTKKAFLQVAAIKLSGDNVLAGASVWADVKIVEDWLSTLPKLTTANLKSWKNKAAADAGGRIGTWIDTHHCE